MSDLRHPELEAAILRDPDDVDAYLVYGDWLQLQGDPRGELIMLMHELERADGPRRAPLQERILALFHDSPRPLLGEMLTRRLGQRVNAEGEPLGVKVGWETEPQGAPQLLVDGRWQSPRCLTKCQLAWRLGFIHKASLGGDGPPTARSLLEPGLAGLIRQLLPHASARFLRTLVVNLTHVDAPEYGSVLQALVETDWPQTLETFDLHVFRQPRGWEAPDTAELDTEELRLEPLYPRLSRLRELRLRGRLLELGTLRLPELRDLLIVPWFDGRTLRRPVVRSIANAELPRLESLHIWMGTPTEASEAHLEDLQPLLDGKGFPSLRKLALVGVEFTDALCERLPHSALLPQLRELELVRGAMTAAGAKALLAKPQAFRNLLRLRLNGGGLDEELRKRLKTLCMHVKVDS
ncbi:TIGR02996 domain-containing protein [Pyxidicoccus sp. 3LFB2]